ncbi:hypothetical protein [Ralstonia solanacearum]|uniref:hypothetical protein n=1 Tax=Ralstonia solanacearum TaxID=305 RepID=UPI0019D15F12|nr:hypothetical protein [Ralstonia solanacearum]
MEAFHSGPIRNDRVTRRTNQGLARHTLHDLLSLREVLLESLQHLVVSRRLSRLAQLSYIGVKLLLSLGIDCSRRCQSQHGVPVLRNLLLVGRILGERSCNLVGLLLECRLFGSMQLPIKTISIRRRCCTRTPTHRKAHPTRGNIRSKVSNRLIQIRIASVDTAGHRLAQVLQLRRQLGRQPSPHRTGQCIATTQPRDQRTTCGMQRRPVVAALLPIRNITLGGCNGGLVRIRRILLVTARHASSGAGRNHQLKCEAVSGDAGANPADDSNSLD